LSRGDDLRPRGVLPSGGLRDQRYDDIEELDLAAVSGQQIPYPYGILAYRGAESGARWGHRLRPWWGRVAITWPGSRRTRDVTGRQG